MHSVECIYKKPEIMLNTFSRLIFWEPAIETKAQEMNGGPGNELDCPRAEQFPHLGNYTLTPGGHDQDVSAYW